MNDPRTTPANARVAAEVLRGTVDAPRYSVGALQRVSVPLTDLLRAPGGARDRQLLLGEAVSVFDIYEGWAFVQVARDGYVGYLPEMHLSARPEPTHRVIARATHLYPEPDFRARETAALSYGSMLEVTDYADERFAETPDGLVPAKHLVPIDPRDPDPVSVAETLLGTPYLWGGNSSFGIDCSGLVQIACLACGIACPGDADMQEVELGVDLFESAPLRRGDLLFWKGHVAWVASPDTLIHANAFHMAVAYEPLHDALTRIEASGDGPVTSRKRLRDVR